MTNLLFSFNGRTGRKAFWIVMVFLFAWGASFDQFVRPFGPENPMTPATGMMTLANFILVAWIGLAVQIKRWHDLDKSGWWAALSLVPLIGPLWILYECGFVSGTPGSNTYGEAS